MLKKLTSGFLLAFGLVAFSSCDQVNLDELRKIIQPAPNPNVVLTAVLNGSQEVPPTPSAATGTFSGVYNKDTNVLTYTVTYTGLTPQAGHLHRGAPGTNGPVIHPFPQLTSPSRQPPPSRKPTKPYCSTTVSTPTCIAPLSPAAK
nr:CHRD domain-containing protein [Hymenobacter radiodurans]